MEAGLSVSHPKSCLPHKLNSPDIKEQGNMTQKGKKLIYQSQPRTDIVAENDNVPHLRACHP